MINQDDAYFQRAAAHLAEGFRREAELYTPQQIQARIDTIARNAVVVLMHHEEAQARARGLDETKKYLGAA